MFRFKMVGEYNVDKLNKLSNSHSDGDWDEYNWRQRINKVHRKTKTIPILYDTEYSRNRGNETQHYSIYREEINNIERLLQEVYSNNGTILRFIITNLPAGCKVGLHKDDPLIDKNTSSSLKLDRRIHIPIKTNKEVIFGIENEIKHLSTNQIWEINNHNCNHWVENNGDTDRLHCILDYRDDMEYKTTLI